MRWLYIVASVDVNQIASKEAIPFGIVDGEDLSLPIAPGAISFEHYEVEADDELDAYDAGHMAASFQQSAGIVRNDYVIPLGVA